MAGPVPVLGDIQHEEVLPLVLGGRVFLRINRYAVRRPFAPRLPRPPQDHHDVRSLFNVAAVFKVHDVRHVVVLIHGHAV